MLLPRVEEVELILTTKQNSIFNYLIYPGYGLQFCLSRISYHDIRDNNISLMHGVILFWISYFNVKLASLSLSIYSCTVSGHVRSVTGTRSNMHTLIQ